jgi:hypothetical protein
MILSMSGDMVARAHEVQKRRLSNLQHLIEDEMLDVFIFVSWLSGSRIPDVCLRLTNLCDSLKTIGNMQYWILFWRLFWGWYKLDEALYQYTYINNPRFIRMLCCLLCSIEHLWRTQSIQWGKKGCIARVQFLAGAAHFISLQDSDRLWCPLILLSLRYRGAFLHDWSDRSVKLTTHLHLVQKPRKKGLYLHSTLRFRGVLLNELSSRSTLLLIDEGVEANEISNFSPVLTIYLVL